MVYTIVNDTVGNEFNAEVIREWWVWVNGEICQNDLLSVNTMQFC